MSDISPQKAIVLQVGDRFFNSYKNKRIQTAWSLAGAKLFQDYPHDHKLKEAEKALLSKGYKFTRRTAVLLD
jgi:hypothetical protein